jgi:pimeloyl-ACP methyl ester carboxylesterase
MDFHKVGIKSMERWEQGVERWLPALVKKLLRTNNEQACNEALAHLPASRLSRTAYGVRSYITAGTGPYTVVFESGLGSGKEVWAPVFNALSAITRVVAYDRAGYGQSERSRRARDGGQIVEELRAMLQAENIPPPYVLVGHSLGGTIMKLFARTYPQEVAGVVLVDARDADFVQRCKGRGLLRLLYEPPVGLFMRGGPEMRRELKAATVTHQQARFTGKFPNIPLSVLTHRRRILHWPSSITRAWAEGQRRMASMSAKGHLWVCDRSGHHIHRDRPDLVVQAVQGVLSAIKQIHIRGHAGV